MRERLPQRRPAETVSLERDGIKFTLTTGTLPDGRIAEIFLSAEHGNSMLDAILNDFGIVASFALQHGATVEDLAAAVRRDHQGLAASPMGAALDHILQPQPERATA